MHLRRTVALLAELFLYISLSLLLCDFGGVSTVFATEHEPSPSSYGDYDFTLTTMEGKQVRLSDYHGKVVLVNFWETWCPPCIAETPSLVQLYNKNKDQGFVIIGVFGSSNDVKVKEFVDRFQIPYAIGRESTGALHSRYQVFGIPALFLFGPDGHLVKRIQGGYGEQTGTVLEPEILALLRTPSIPQETSSPKTATPEKSEQERPESRQSATVLHDSPVPPQATPQVQTVALEVSQPTRTVAYSRWNLIVPLLALIGLLVLSRVHISVVPAEATSLTPPRVFTSEQPVPYARLVCQRPSNGLPHEIALVHDDAVMGSGTECDVILRHPSIAPRHARVQWRKQGYILCDLQSRTGTSVNGRRITENLLKDGWRVRLGEIEFVFYEATTHV